MPKQWKIAARLIGAVIVVDAISVVGWVNITPAPIPLLRPIFQPYFIIIGGLTYLAFLALSISLIVFLYHRSRPSFPTTAARVQWRN